jgi:hypothetical protein
MGHLSMLAVDLEPAVSVGVQALLVGVEHRGELFPHVTQAEANALAGKGSAFAAVEPVLVEVVVGVGHRALFLVLLVAERGVDERWWAHALALLEHRGPELQARQLERLGVVLPHRWLVVGGRLASGACSGAC